MDQDKFSYGTIIKNEISQCSFLLIVIFITILSSCKSQIKDGPPHFYVNEKKICNAVPKSEPLSKFGNKPYRVFGKRYQVMPKNSPYSEVGIASWYGTKFHKRRTSSGEPYNMLAMTAAHKHLPLPTYVEVLNLENHRKIIVKVNDRGPFEANRLIDLSYVAAKKLDMLKRGTAKVRVTAIHPAPSPSFFSFWHLKKPAPPAITTHEKLLQDFKTPIKPLPIYLQVGAFHEKANAEKLKNQLGGLLFVPITIDDLNFHSNRAHFYRVRIGPLKDLATANRITHHLLTLGFKSNRMRGF